VQISPASKIYKSCASSLTRLNISGLSGTRTSNGNGPAVSGGDKFNSTSRWWGTSISVQLLQDLEANTNHSFQFFLINDHLAQSQISLVNIFVGGLSIAPLSKSLRLIGTKMQIRQAEVCECVCECVGGWVSVLVCVCLCVCVRACVSSLFDILEPTL